MVVSWPARIKDKGGLRAQFTHVIDVVPTILEVTGIPAPGEVDGNRLTLKLDRPQPPPADIKKLEAAMKAAADGPVSQDLTLVQRLEARFEKREECRKKADAQKLGPIERIEFVRGCLA